MLKEWRSAVSCVPSEGFRQAQILITAVSGIETNVTVATILLKEQILQRQEGWISLGM
jgi:hypothetical protein